MVLFLLHQGRSSGTIEEHAEPVASDHGEHVPQASIGTGRAEDHEVVEEDADERGDDEDRSDDGFIQDEI